MAGSARAAVRTKALKEGAGRVDAFAAGADGLRSAERVTEEQAIGNKAWLLAAEGERKANHKGGDYNGADRSAAGAQRKTNAVCGNWVWHSHSFEQTADVSGVRNESGRESLSGPL
jgi:hypothetical protein